LEKLVILRSAFLGKRVWLSGHTGFKGGWLATWLLEAGAMVTGFSLPPVTPFFRQLRIGKRLRHEIGDLQDFKKVRQSILRCRPHYVFHLAAQPLVRESYRNPLETYEVNALGTGHVLQALRELRNPCAAVLVTTDKVYRNKEQHRAFRESDALGGKDPYSASKAAAEILIESYHNSFFQNHPVRIASARSGNVIGGGDYAENRIVPDAFRALRSGRAIPVRNPASIRPWQHVLEPTTGYLVLALHLSRNRKTARAYNFGPSPRDQKTVSALVRQILKNWPGRWQRIREKNPPHESGRLQLNNQKAWRELGWKPRLSFAQSVGMTMDWYRESIQPNFDAFQACRKQIEEYSNLDVR
jgi:CDP-glucose 4,6-dehydratase